MRTRKNLKQTQDKLVAILDEAARLLDDESLAEKREAFARAKTVKAKAKIITKAMTEISKNPNQEDDSQIKDYLNTIKNLSEDLNCVFEWHDGILVEAMQEGGLLLIDEISLANDSVLERLNSVFEQDRVLMVTEKSS